MNLWPLILNLFNSVHNFTSNGSETKNSGIKTSTLAREHVSTQGTLAREHVFSTQATQFSRLGIFQSKFEVLVKVSQEVFLQPFS